MPHLLRREEALDSDQLGKLAEVPHRAARLVLAAAATGEIEAQALLGQILLEGRGIQADPELALTWFGIAAGRGHAMACNMAGRCHELGWGCPANPARAAERYRRAADMGLDWGMYNLANLLATGRGIPQDEVAAYRLYRQAAELGHAKSMNLTGRAAVCRATCQRRTAGIDVPRTLATFAASSAMPPCCSPSSNGTPLGIGWTARLRLAT